MPEIALLAAFGAEGQMLKRRQDLDISRILVVLGLALVAAGLLWPLLLKLGLGRLPGDIMIERDGFRLYLPIATSLLASVAASLLFWLFRR